MAILKRHRIIDPVFWVIIIILNINVLVKHIFKLDNSKFQKQKKSTLISISVECNSSLNL